MKDKKKSSTELIIELEKLQHRVTKLEAENAKYKIVEESLRANEETLHMFYQNSPLPYQSLNEDGNFIAVNDAFLEKLGYTGDEIIGRSFGHIVSEEYASGFDERFPEFKKSGKVEAEFELVCKNGEHINVRLDGIVNYNLDGSFKQTHCIWSDITERKKAEQELRKSHDHLENLVNERTAKLQQVKKEVQESHTMLTGVLESIHMPVFSIDKEYCYTSFNTAHAAAMKQVYGVEIEIGKNVLDYHLVTEDRIKAKKNFDRALKGELVLDEEFAGKDELSRLFFEISHDPIRDHQGNIIGVCVLAKDITKRKQTEILLRESEIKFRSIYEKSPSGIVYVSKDGKILDCNPAFLDLTGYDMPEILEKSIQELTHPEDMERELALVVRLQNKKNSSYQIEKRYITKDKSSIWIDGHVSCTYDKDGETEYFIAVVQDITKRKQAELQLKQSQANLLAQAENTKDDLWMVDTNLRLITLNSNFKNNFEKAFSTTLEPGLSPLDYLPESLVSMWRDRYQRALDGEAFTIVDFYDIPDVPNWVEISYNPIIIEGTVEGVVCTSRDITESKQAELSLKESEERYRLLFTQSPLGIVRTDLDGILINVNDHFAEIFGAPRENLIGFNTLEQITNPQMTQAIKDALGGEPGFFEGDYTSVVTGKTIAMRTITQPIILSSGEIGGSIGIFEDITERKRATEQLHLQATALNATANGIVITDNKGAILWINQAFTALTGYTVEESIGKNPRVLQSGEHNDAFHENMWNTILSGQVWRGEVINKRKDGKLYTEGMTITPVRNSRGEITHFVAIKQDITEQVWAVEKLRQSELQLALVTGMTQTAYWEFDLHSFAFTFTDQLFSILHTTAEQAGGYEVSVEKFLQQFVHPDDTEIISTEIQKALEITNPDNKTSFEYRAIGGDGEVQNVAVDFRVELDDQGRAFRAYGSHMNITERKQTEIKLQESEAKLRSIYENTPSGITYVSKDGKILDCNPAFHDLLGYSKPEILKKSIPELTHPEDVARQSILVNKVRNKEIGRYRIEKRYITKDQTVIWTDGQVSCVYDEDGEINHFISGVHDITERKKAEQALIESEERYRSLVDLSPDGVFVTTGSEIVYANSACAHLVGAHQVDELIGESVIDFIHPDNRQAAIESMQVDSIKKGPRSHIEQKVIRRDGKVIDVEYSRAPVLYQGMPSIQAVFRDITERKQAEQQLQHMVAHDQLTGLPNRATFLARLNHALPLAKRNQQHLAVIFIDLDDFKAVNDTFGHDTGDQLLIAIADQLRDSVRESDTVARLAGDELIILLENLAKPKDAAIVAEKILTQTADPIQLGKHQVKTGASVGISIYPQDGVDPDMLIQHADQAMYKAKNSGKQSYRYFSDI